MCLNMNSKLDALRKQIRALEGHSLESSRQFLTVPFADRRLNVPLPRGGLETAALHEFCAGSGESESAAAVTAFTLAAAALILRGRDGFLLWAASVADCYPPGLSRFGPGLPRIIWADCRKDVEVLSVMEEALHSRGLAAVLGEAGALSLKMGRRLDAAARQSGITALLLRRHRSKPSKEAAFPSGAAATRWRVSAVPAGLLGPALPRWRLDLEYCRNGKTASWIVEVSDGSDSDRCETGHVRVVTELRDDARPLEAASARKTANAARSV
jgi:protein ImuA